MQDAQEIILNPAISDDEIYDSPCEKELEKELEAKKNPEKKSEKELGKDSFAPDIINNFGFDSIDVAPLQLPRCTFIDWHPSPFYFIHDGFIFPQSRVFELADYKTLEECFIDIKKFILIKAKTVQRPNGSW